MNNIIHYIEDFTNPVVDKKFSIGELFFLKYIDNSKVDNYYYPNYFEHLYKINYQDTIYKFKANELIEIMPVQETLANYTIAQLKDVLKKYNLAVSGKKDDVIQRIKDNLSENEISNFFKDKYYKVTKKGERLINDNTSDFEYSNRFDLFYIIPFLKRTFKYVMKNDYSDSYFKHFKKEEIDVCKSFYEEKTIDDKRVQSIIIMNNIINSRYQTIQKSIKYYLDKDYELGEIAYYIRRMKAVAELERYKSYEFNVKYSIMTMNDEKECDYCKSLSDKVFNLNDAVIGENYPPFSHCKSEFCRCIALPITKFEI